MWTGTVALREELYDTMDNPMDNHRDFRASKRALKHGPHSSKSVMGSIRTMEFPGVPVNRV